ncbi:anionic trypsin-2-like isoform X4 [Oratosquilla oratoria]|uniref:anionic trypsin-2-like isoform X4 n=1 Tax=Oratosquilla oratoria TaxID=337810 RepID=UPI003F762805
MRQKWNVLLLVVLLGCCGVVLGQGSSSVTDVSPPSVSFICGTRPQIPITFGLARRFVESPIARPNFRSEIVKKFDGDPDLRPLTPSSLGSLLPQQADFSSFRPDSYTVQVYNGVVSIKSSWPWMALLGEENNPRAPWFCDGVLINEQWVLTAAHCIIEKVPHVVRLGEHDLSSTHASNHQDYYVKKFVFHPDYDHKQVYHDLALIQLKQRVSITGSIRPVCLPWGSHPLPATGSLLTLTGWGGTYYNGPRSDVLQEASLYLLPASKCVAGYSTLHDYAQKYPKGITSDLLCIGDTDGQGQDACQGDSGGPVMHRRNNKYYLSGIVSLGYGCGKPEFPGIYASVHHSPDLAWIKRVAF